MNEQNNGEDRISAFPDDIICNILSNLHVGESARTSVLSKRWHNIWLLSPITISDESVVNQSSIYCFIEEESSSLIVNVISYIIYTHPGPIPTCHFILPDWREHHETLVNLLKILTLKGIQNLQIDLKDFKVPSFVLECDSLVDFQLKCGLMPTQLPIHMDIFPNLKKLNLTLCEMNNEFLVSLFSSRSMIIELALIDCYGFADVVIESDSLQKLCFKGKRGSYGGHLTIKDVPNLVTFKCNPPPRQSKVVILNAPKLKILSRIETDMSLLQLGNYQFNFCSSYVKIRGEIAYVPSLRSLGIVVDFHRGYEEKSIPHFLMCLPCLETLKVRMMGEPSPYYRGRYNEYHDSDNDVAAIVIDADYEDCVRLMSNINCLKYHLKNVKLKEFLGIPAHLEFARLIVANAKVLETLTIIYRSGYEGRRMKAQKRFLMQNRASRMLHIEFFKREHKLISKLMHV